MSIKAQPLSLVLPDSKEKSYLINVFDTPGSRAVRYITSARVTG